MGTGPEHEGYDNLYCSGSDCLCTRRFHLDPVDHRIVLCDYCGRTYHLRERKEVSEFRLDAKNRIG